MQTCINQKAQWTSVRFTALEMNRICSLDYVGTILSNLRSLFREARILKLALVTE